MKFNSYASFSQIRNQIRSAAMAERLKSRMKAEVPGSNPTMKYEFKERSGKWNMRKRNEVKMKYEFKERNGK